MPKARRLLKEKGFDYVAHGAKRRIRVKLRSSILIPFWHKYYTFFKSRRTFVFQHREYGYFYHKYNLTWQNERAVEVPIVWAIVESSKGRILEVGNVLSHYFNLDHDIIDKYEKGKGVSNEDITEIATEKRYDLIISISTLEHVGWDENPHCKERINDSEKILLAMSKLAALLNKNGIIVVTMPLGYNPHLDELLRSSRLRFDSQFCLRRISKDNRWTEIDCEEAWKDPEYNYHIPSANQLIVGILQSK